MNLAFVIVLLSDSVSLFFQRRIIRLYYEGCIGFQVTEKFKIAQTRDYLPTQVAKKTKSKAVSLFILVLQDAFSQVKENPNSG